MPLYWNIDSHNGLFEVVYDGLAETAEVDGLMDVAVGCKSLGYRKLLDLSCGETGAGRLDIMSSGVAIRSLHAGCGALGPLAVVVPDDKYPLFARVLGILAIPRRPMRLFSKPNTARAWLDTPAIRRFGR